MSEIQEIEWTEERAIKALEENQQVMIPGLREQAQGQKVYVEHEYAKQNRGQSPRPKPANEEDRRET